MIRRLQSLLQDQSAATMVEYGIMVALIAAISIAVIKVLGKKVSNSFETINNAMNGF